MSPDIPRVAGTDGRAVPDGEPDVVALAELLAEVLRKEGLGSGAQASITLVDSEEIASLKAEHLGGDGLPTDVLSFPIDGASPPDDGGDGWIVGDVVICPTIAEAQALDHTGNLEDELALLVTHGGLHLVGWDHAEPDERRAMWSRERELMVELHRLPEKDPWGGAE